AQDFQADWQICWTGVIASFSIRSRGDAEDIRVVGSEGCSRRVGGVPEEGSGGIDDERNEGTLRSWRQECSQAGAPSVLNTIDRGRKCILLLQVGLRKGSQRGRGNHRLELDNPNGTEPNTWD